ncbi:MAG TPA: glycosyltransferase [Anaeromyxobacteraceae bacterium]|nr:glycosyltransferase [Anaeromyxobacteraceae bacterium]
MPRISLCMIARNEERMLPGCLESVKGVVDEIVLVDTGSTDATKDIALRHGARVYDRPWDDDFAAPRNLALSHARGDWVLHLDADERLAHGSAGAIRRAIKGTDRDLFMLSLHDASRLDAPEADVLSGAARIGAPTLVPRLLRRTPDLEYRGVVHESVEDWLVRRGYRLAVLDVHVVHLGAVVAVRAALGKRGRNVALLERRCREEPDSIVPFGYLAMELWHEERFEDARRVADEGWKLLDLQPRHRSAHLLSVARALGLGRAGEFEEMRATAERVIAREGLQSDQGFLRGWAIERMAMAASGEARRDLLEKAVRAYRDVLGPRARADDRVVVDGSPSWLTRTRLGTTLLALGSPAEALAEFRAARKEVPGDEAARLGEAEALLDRGDAAAAQDLLGSILGEKPDAWTLSADAARVRGEIEDARRYLRGARERYRAGFLAPHRSERLAALVKALASRTEESAELLDALMQRRPPPDRLCGAELDVRFLRRVVEDFLPAGKADLLVPLLEPAAEAACPGLSARMRAILAELGAEVVEDPPAPPPSR